MYVRFLLTPNSFLLKIDNIFKFEREYYYVYVIDKYQVGAGTRPGLDDTVPSEMTDAHTTVKCWNTQLNHNKKYYSTVTAYHGGYEMMNATAVSNGGRQLLQINFIN